MTTSEISQKLSKYAKKHIRHWSFFKGDNNGYQIYIRASNKCIPIYIFLPQFSHLHRIFTNKCNKHSTTYTQIHLMNVRTITRQLLTYYLHNCFVLKKYNNVKENSLDKITYLLPTHLFCT